MENYGEIDLKTDLLRDLLEIRQRAIENGLELLSVDEILDLVQKRWNGQDDLVVELDENLSRHLSSI